MTKPGTTAPRATAGARKALQRLAAADHNTPEAIEALNAVVAIMTDKTASAEDRLETALAVLELGHGPVEEPPEDEGDVSVGPDDLRNVFFAPTSDEVH